MLKNNVKKVIGVIWTICVLVVCIMVDQEIIKTYLSGGEYYWDVVQAGLLIMIQVELGKSFKKVYTWCEELLDFVGERVWQLYEDLGW